MLFGVVLSTFCLLLLGGFHRQNSNKEDGWIRMKIGNEGAWQNKWFIFEDGVLKYGASPSAPDATLTQVPMDQVISLKTDNAHENTIVITTVNYKLYLNLANTVEMHKWLFAFQKSVALVLTHLMKSAESHATAGKVSKTPTAKLGMPSPEKCSLSHKSSHGSSHGRMDVRGSPLGNRTPEGRLFSNDRSVSTDNDGRFEFRHSDGADNALGRALGSTAIPINPAAQKPSHHGHHSHQAAHSHHAHSHHSSHAHAHSHHSRSKGLAGSTGDNLGASSYGYLSGRGESVDKLATSFKEENDKHLRLEELLQSDTEGSRSRGNSGDSNSESEGEDPDGDWKSRGSNEMQDDEDE